METTALDIIITLQNEASAKLTELQGQMDGLAKSTNNASKSATNHTKTLNTIAAAAAVVGVGIGIVADKTIKAAEGFQQELTTLVTGAGESASNIQMIGDSLLKMSAATGTSTSQLTSGLYMIESAGYHGSAGLQVLQAAAEGAKVGNADLGTVADATTTIMKDFGGTLPTNAVNILTATVANGKTHMQDLAQSLSQILPTASAAKVGLNDTMGAMATMTGEGVPAANAATYLRQMIIALEAPSATASKSLKSVGLTTAEVSTEMQKSLPDALALITNAVGKKFPAGSAEYVNAIKNISGGSRTMQGMLDLTGQHLTDFRKNVQLVSNSVNESGGKIIGWSEIQKEAAFQQQKLIQSVSALGITLGTALLPTFTKIMQSLTNFVHNITTWIAQNQKTVTTIIMVVGSLSVLMLGIIGIIKIVQSLQTIWSGLSVAFAASSGIMSVVTGPWLIAIAAVIAIVVLMITHWNQVKPVLAEVSNIFKSVVLPVINSVWNSIKNELLPALLNIWNIIKPILIPILEILGTVIGVVLVGAITLIIIAINNFIKFLSIGVGALSEFMKGIKEVASGNFAAGFANIGKAILNGLLMPVKLVIAGFNTLIQGADKIPGIKIPTIPQIPQFASGVNNFSGGMAIVGENGPELVNLPRGSNVTPNNQLNSNGAGSINITINGDVDSTDRIRQLAQAVSQEIGRNQVWMANGAY